MTDHVHFTGLSIDRAHTQRRDAGWLADMLAGPERRILPVWRGQHAVDGAFGALSLDEPGAHETVFLGLIDGVPWFAADVSDLDAPPDLGGSWQELRAVGAAGSARDAGLMAYARGLLGWHRKHGFCGVCGAATEVLEGGHLRLCTNTACATPHFPRTDPAVIMLVVDDQGRALLGRQAKWPPGMVSTLAGFVEPGETLEQAVAREVEEESGIRVGAVTYVASQPWPFPSSLMLAFEARAETTAITVDQTELESAQWFTREEVRTFREVADMSETGGEGWALPARISIARVLIERWLARED